MSTTKPYTAAQEREALFAHLHDLATYWLNESRTPTEKGRAITVDGVKWKWQAGRSDVVAYSERGDKVLSTPWQIKRMSPTEWERAQCTSYGSLTPSEVASWLMRHMVERSWRRMLS